ncbi:MAG: ester cyclase [Bacteroidales bacterium]|nr:ester cyclase [Bacteroidales bacterium]
MKRLLFAMLVFPFLMSCSSGNDSSEKNIAVVDKYIQSVENMDYKTMETLLADDYQGYGPSFNDSVGKEQAIESWKYNVQNLYKKIEYKKEQHAPVFISKGPNKGDWVSSWAELFITYKSGETVTIWANTTYKVENGKITKSYTFYNEADAFRQLGFVFIHPDDL